MTASSIGSTTGAGRGKITETAAWNALESHRRAVAGRHLRDLFAEDPSRGRTMAVQAGDLYVDLSKHRATSETSRLLVDLAEERHLRECFAELLAGEHVNTTEDRPALHTALRRPAGQPLVVDGVDVVSQVHSVLSRMDDLARRVRDGSWRGATGEPVRSVVNIGIGGSDLGPAMAATALNRWVRDDLSLQFVSNVDGDDLAGALRAVDPATTLFVVASKSFTTLETLTNARHARDWLTARLGEDAVPAHFVALSTNLPAVSEFGIDPDNALGFWDWVGGRYSVDSAVGLSLMIGIGPEAFADFLEGFRRIDLHLRDSPLDANAPVLMALLNLWYRNFFGAQTQAVLPYSQALARFPAYLQQLEMESNGKRVTIDGAPSPVDTAPIVWGEPGTNGQHAFFQLLHQGTTMVPCDMIGFAHPTDEMLAGTEHHDLLNANLLAQAEALAFGRTAEEVASSGVDDALVPHRTFPGNVPTTTILAPRLTPGVLGQLIALYEHKVAAQGFLWGINSFDQWGVELGKALAADIAAEIAAGTDGRHDSSTTELLRRYREMRGG
jgi:glucose-6-phosphate isomerase